MNSFRFETWQLFFWMVLIGMLIQIGVQIPEIKEHPLAAVAGGMLFVFGIVGGNIFSHERSTRHAIRAITIFLFVVLSFQWSTSFRDDYSIWSLRWACVGLFTGTLFGSHASSDLDTESELADAEEGYDNASSRSNKSESVIQSNVDQQEPVDSIRDQR